MPAEVSFKYADLYPNMGRTTREETQTDDEDKDVLDKDVDNQDVVTTKASKVTVFSALILLVAVAIFLGVVT